MNRVWEVLEGQVGEIQTKKDYFKPFMVNSLSLFLFLLLLWWAQHTFTIFSSSRENITEIIIYPRECKMNTL